MYALSRKILDAKEPGLNLDLASHKKNKKIKNPDLAGWIKWYTYGLI